MTVKVKTHYRLLREYLKKGYISEELYNELYNFYIEMLNLYPNDKDKADDYLGSRTLRLMQIEYEKKNYVKPSTQEILDKLFNKQEKEEKQPENLNKPILNSPKVCFGLVNSNPYYNGTFPFDIEKPYIPTTELIISAYALKNKKST